MMEALVMTLIGRDRPGLVETVSAIIEDHGGNWEESRMVRLAGEFAGLLHVHVPPDRTSDLTDALGRLEGMSVVVDRAVDLAPAEAETHLFELELVGHDHPGIVHRLAQTLVARRVNVEELETEVISAAMSGQPLFQARARLRAPKDLTAESLARDLEQLAGDLMVDIRLEEPAG